MPKPSDPSHSAAVAELAIAGATVLGGRTMVLTTTLRAMRTIGTALANAFSGSKGIEVMVQGQMPKRELLERFGAPHKSADPAMVAGCVLVASVSFWEGIDIPGETLQLLVIDKLPFSPPDDPLQRARAVALEAQGKSPFKLLHLPQAGVALKQGAGRLIRRESDRGVLVVCDVRLTQMGYGKKLLAGLPRMAHLPDRAAFIAQLEGFTKPSTTDPCWVAPPESTVPTADS
jgi:ATP-dependent DNA helicase DinG